MSKDILTALRHPAAGLGAAGFVDVEQAVLECPISDEISWRCAIVREPDEDPWFGEIMVGIWVPDLRPTLRFGWPKRCDPGIYTRNLFDLADSRGAALGRATTGRVSGEVDSSVCEATRRWRRLSPPTWAR